jgi:hypothetical protein
VEGKATERKRKNVVADKTRAMETNGKPPMTQNGGQGNKSHQLTKTNTPVKKTWADVIRTGGINVQIGLGNGNLGLTTPTKTRGERRGGPAWRLVKRGVAGERGAMRKGTGGPDETTSGGKKGGQRGKNGRGREEDREEPGAAASEQTGLRDKMTHG